MATTRGSPPRRRLLLLLLGLASLGLVQPKKDVPGMWESPTASFDLRELTHTSAYQTYVITDGDIECTDALEADYTYLFNFFADVSNYDSVPTICGDDPGAAVQYGLNGANCHTVGRYDPDFDDQIWSLYDTSKDADPSKGVTLTYLDGDECRGGIKRQLALHVLCANHPYRVVHAQETSRCQYEINVESWYGCPTECPVTSDGGVCDSHGLCMMEMNAATHATPHCYCNEGYKGADCSSKAHSHHSSSDSPEGMQIAFLVVLLVIFFGLVGAVAYMTVKVMRYRKETTESYTAFNAMTEREIEM